MGLDAWHNSAKGQLVLDADPGMGKRAARFLLRHRGRKLVCVNARTGDPIWRYQISAGGVNGTLLPIEGAVVGGHADENLDSSEIGRTVAVKTGAEPAAGSKSLRFSTKLQSSGATARSC